MLRGLYTAAAGMITQQRNHDTITNNIANLNTPGYKQVNAISRSFPEMLISLVNSEDGQASRQIGRLNTGIMIEENVMNFMQGDIVETNNPADFALTSNIQLLEEVDGQLEPIAFDESGKGINQAGESVVQPQAYFTVVNNEDEQRYTRNGKLVVNDAGELITSDGNRMLGQSGEPVLLTIPIDAVKMTTDGRLHNGITGQPLLDDLGDPISLLISQVDNPHRLIDEGNGMYRLDNPEDDPARPIDNIAEMNVVQGFIERSNVDPAQAMVNMMTAARAYEANQKVIQYYDKSLDKAVNEVGRV